MSADLDVLVWICPQQVAQQAAVRYVCWARHTLDLLQRLELRRQTPVHAQDLGATHTAASARGKTSVTSCRLGWSIAVMQEVVCKDVLNRHANKVHALGTGLDYL